MGAFALINIEGTIGYPILRVLILDIQFIVHLTIGLCVCVARCPRDNPCTACLPFVAFITLVLFYLDALYSLEVLTLVG